MLSNVNTRGDHCEFAPYILNMNGLQHRSSRSFIEAMDQLKYDICSGDILQKYNVAQSYAESLSVRQRQRRRKLKEADYLPERMPNDPRYRGSANPW